LARYVTTLMARYVTRVLARYVTTPKRVKSEE